MLKIVAKNRLKEGSKDAVLALLDEMIARTREEVGCIKYELYERVGEPNLLVFIEEWESKESLDAHMNSEHFKRLIPQVGEYKEANDPVEVYRLIK
ncbi:MAG: antibiotic biosynthesis monooxygenase [Clostridiales Family XIII bacterium]|nr:antibiotic biosynthesis monooxygenase [Clostridiales Family XIII bacterium]